MTRISGFEIIAKDSGHVGSFMTITCPSRMHRWKTVNNGKVIENKKYDGTNPAQAQAYLSQTWARIRASLARQKIFLYGFRVAEPQHDGTPHWHFLIFHQEQHTKKIESTVWKYALKDSPNEAGAHAHRVDFKAIDPSKGTASGYIAKYIAKNIDGLHVGSDLYGNPAMETSLRVETWATTWGIRQFQQIGGAPVTVWRELRRKKCQRQCRIICWQHGKPQTNTKSKSILVKNQSHGKITSQLKVEHFVVVNTKSDCHWNTKLALASMVNH
jgi:hypothetical protein